MLTEQYVTLLYMCKGSGEYVNDICWLKCQSDIFLLECQYDMKLLEYDKLVICE